MFQEYFTWVMNAIIYFVSYSVKLGETTMRAMQAGSGGG